MEEQYIMNHTQLVEYCIEKAFDKFEKKMFDSFRKFKKMEFDDQQITNFRNTKLLLKNYNELLAHASKSVTCLQDIIDNKYDFDDDELQLMLTKNIEEDVYINSIKRTRSRTLLMVNHIERHLVELRKIAENKGCLHKYQMLYDFYIIGRKQESIAEEHNCHVVQVSNWIKEMLDEYNILIWGVEAIKLY
jgi:uncharacterized protein YjcR